MSGADDAGDNGGAWKRAITMVICHCLAVNDRAIAELATDETVTVDDVAAMCGAGGECGGCHDSIDWILTRARATREVRVELPSCA